ncbi:MAG: bifunctional glutamate N-acetyltransferase/amino-acid acetyltransferase ArgJ [Oscillospiraceae bacterium]|jgi:glutamate N-acetyltransferase/amino-acid N-acetyltransferase|nr:bifunctional glutamate N-acetyltransferase/amino-acid acetyltransferase ArgJ [Oscillospiraceae bacterium]
MLNFFSSGVCAPRGFRAGGIHCGIRRNQSKPDLALIAGDVPCQAAAVYTKNIVKAAPLLVTKEHLRAGAARAIVVNSGNANACAPDGEVNALRMCRAAAAALGLAAEDVLVASTGVIGQRLNAEVIENALPRLTAGLSSGAEGSAAAARAIMTTDTVPKEFAVECEIGGVSVRIGGIAKGSGMIHPNMGTMLCFLTTDCAISGVLLDRALRSAVRESFNRISVDGDTSTNDMAVLLSSGLAGNPELTAEDSDYAVFDDALCALCVKLARAMAADGEGAKHLITCKVSEAETEAKAEAIAKSVISSSLFKAAVFGEDANWGRVLCAMGYAGQPFNPDRVDVSFRSAAGEIAVCRQGRGLAFDEALAKTVLHESEVEVLVSLGEETAPGDFGWCECWGCDLTYDYVKINGDYRT